jgi:hypothetical protein
MHSTLHTKNILVLTLAGIVSLAGVTGSLAQNDESSAAGNAELTQDAPKDDKSVRSGPGGRDDMNDRVSGAGPVSPSVGASAGVPLAGTSQLGGAAPARMERSEGSLLRWGPVELHPHTSFSASYGNGLQASPGIESSSWYFQLAPGLGMNLGKDWVLDYTPTLRWYTDPDFEDGVDHAVSLTGRTEYRDWLFGLSQGFGISSEPLVETASQTEEETWSTSLSASRALSSKVAVDLGLSQDLRFVNGSSQQEQLTDTLQWATMNWLNYQYVKELTFGVGAGFTYEQVEIGSDMTSEQLQARVSWNPGEKLTFVLEGGADIRQFLDSDAEDMITPIYSLTADYSLFENTSLFVSASRDVTPSYYSETVTDTIGFSTGARQRLMGRFFLTVSVGYGSTEYSGTETGGTGLPTGVDDYKSTSFNVSLATRFGKRGDVSVFYSKTWNKSDSIIYQFDPETVGIQLSYGL